MNQTEHLQPCLPGCCVFDCFFHESIIRSAMAVPIADVPTA